MKQAENLIQQRQYRKTYSVTNYQQLGDTAYSAKNYKRAYTWYYLSGQRAMYDNHSLLTRPILQLFWNIISLGGLLFNYPYNEIDVIEGEGLFNFAKLSGSEIQAARDDAHRKITAEYAETNSWILDLLTQSGIAGNKTAQKKLADMYYEGSEEFGMSPDYRKAYIWYYIHGSRTDYDKYSGITSLSAQAVDNICTNVVSMGGLIFVNELEMIEGAGMFNSAKPPDAEITSALTEVRKHVQEIYASRIAATLEVKVKSAIIDQASRKKLADMFYKGDEDLGIKPDYETAYTWYYVYGQRPMYEKHGFLMRNVLRLFWNLISAGGLLFNFHYNEIDIIEGEGLFNLAKLTKTEIKNAQSYARHVIAEIPAEIHEGADRLDGGGFGGSELVSGIVKEVLTELAAHALKTQLIR
ncbi:MAG: SEL1-like repeat protein [Synergistaceae bacterium]|nr:SEL1-like repeat protein [Synergistaceae bacterium]